MIGIIIFFSKINYDNACEMSQTAIFEHLSSIQYHKVLKVDAKVSNLFYSSIIWAVFKFIESNYSWYALGTSI